MNSYTLKNALHNISISIFCKNSKFIITILVILFLSISACNQKNLWENEFLNIPAILSDVTLSTAHVTAGVLKVDWTDPADIKATDTVHISCAESATPTTIVATGTAAAGVQTCTIPISFLIEYIINIKIIDSNNNSSSGLSFKITPIASLTGYFVYTRDDLNAIRGTDPDPKYTGWGLGAGKIYYLMADLDLSGYNPPIDGDGNGWMPIGSSLNQFYSNFDGMGHTISNLIINRASSNYQGLFGYILGGNVKNITILSGSVIGNSFVGGLAGYNTGTISGCISSAVISGSGDAIGGLIGWNTGSLTNCNTTLSATVDNTSTGIQYYAGGLVGYNSSTGIITSCHAFGTVTANLGQNEATGGLVGYNIGNITGVTGAESYAAGIVRGYIFTGGLVGDSLGGSISYCYASGNVEGLDIYIGGLIGHCENTNVSYSYAAGNVTEIATGTAYVGGLIGYYYYNLASGTITVSNSYATGNVISAGDYTGGLIGCSDNISTGTIELNTCHSTGTVNSTAGFTGGLVGQNIGGTIINCYATGNVNNLVVISGNHIGGLVGHNYMNSSIQTSYSTGRVTGYNINIGGLVGLNDVSTITGSWHITGDVIGVSDTGGLVGNNAGTVTNCSSSGLVTGSGSRLGGLVGQNSLGSSVISYSSSSCIVTGTGSSNNVGGLVGICYYTGVTYSHAIGDVTGGTNVGGLTGYINGNSTECYATGAVYGSGSRIGGLIGFIYTGTISLCYASGFVNGAAGTSDIGGFSGGSSGTIENCYAMGTVSVTSTSTNIGGFVGNLTGGIIQYVYAAGYVSHYGTYGGLLGTNSGGTINNTSCFYDANTTLCDNTGTNGTIAGMAESTANMLDNILPNVFTMALWDFLGESSNGTNDYWTIDGSTNGGYPYFTP
jgi:hypothetical protein